MSFYSNQIQAPSQDPQPFPLEKVRAENTNHKHWKNTNAYANPAYHSDAQDFLTLFPHRAAYLYRGSESDSHWATSRFELTDSKILKAISLDVAQIFGCRFGPTSYFGVIDIDAGSKYHSRTGRRRVCRLLKRAKLKHIVYRSSLSEGLHIYLWFEKPLPSDDIEWLLILLFEGNGFEIAKGQFEIFPSRSFGLRLPLQYGFAFLNQKTFEVVAETWEVGAAKAINWFLADREDNLNHIDLDKHFATVFALQRKAAIAQKWSQHGVSETMKKRPTRVTGGRGGRGGQVHGNENNHLWRGGREGQVGTLRANFDHITSRECKPSHDKQYNSLNVNSRTYISDRWLQGRDFYLKGLDSPGQRSEALFCVGYYLYLGDRSLGIAPLGHGHEEDRAKALYSWLFKKHNGFSKEINQGKFAEVQAHIDRLVWSGSNNERLRTAKYAATYRQSGNNKRQLLAIKRIKTAIQQHGLANTGVKSIRQFNELTGIPRATLAKHKKLWQHLLAVYKLQHPSKGRAKQSPDRLESAKPPVIPIQLIQNKTKKLAYLSAWNSRLKKKREEDFPLTLRSDSRSCKCYRLTHIQSATGPPALATAL